PDFVLFEGVALLDAIVALRAVSPDVKLIVDFHNVESQLDREIVAARFPSILKPLARLLSQNRLEKARRADIQAGELVDTIWTCSERDRAEVLRLGVEKPVH